MLLFVPEGNFKFLVLWKQIGPLCTGECEKLVCIAEILVTLGVLRWPARFFVYKRCSFDVTGLEKTLLVTLYILAWSVEKGNKFHNCNMYFCFLSIGHISFDYTSIYHPISKQKVRGSQNIFYCKSSGNLTRLRQLQTDQGRWWS